VPGPNLLLSLERTCRLLVAMIIATSTQLVGKYEEVVWVLPMIGFVGRNSLFTVLARIFHRVLELMEECVK